MTRVFQIFRKTDGALHAVGTGWAWMSFPAPWLWAFAHGLWFRGAAALAVDALVAMLVPSLLGTQAVALALVALVPRMIALRRGFAWISESCENRGWEYLGEIVGGSKSDAIAHTARAGGTIPADRRPRRLASPWAFPPAGFRPMWAVAWLTVRAAFRYRLVVVLMALLVGAVIVLPVVIKHDGTAQGFTQILLTYTLGVISALLSLVTLWLACGTLARDVDECQMQVVATKPIPRWQIWFGKWLGVMLLNAMLLAVSTGAVFLLLQWRATQLPLQVQEALRSNVLTSRAAVKEPPPDLDAKVDALIQERRSELTAQGVDLRTFRAQAREMIKAREQLVPPEYFRRFELDFRGRREHLKRNPIFVRLKFHTPELSSKRPYEIEVVAGPPESPQRVGTMQKLAAEASHEIELGGVVLDAREFLVVEIANRSDTPLIFPMEDGFEVLYREGGFGLNYVRAVIVLACSLGLLAAIGLFAASFLSFPVAAFLATTVLILGLSTGTLKSVVEDRTVMGFEHDTNTQLYPAVDAVMVPLFDFLLQAVNLVQQFSPIDAVSSGRSVTWADVARAVLLVVVLMGGAFAAVGVGAFTRRELATAQSHL
ncbi:MAG: ABC transporter permease [Verrucomicrobiales bacterium]|nr:ABC transporter permease [Verrucomicrobiales bacterium]